MSRPPGARWAPLVALLLALTACSTVPSASGTVQIPDVPSRPVETVGVEPLPPEPGATPDEIVRGFIEAAASFQTGHPVARQHLSPEAAGSWSDETGITVLSPDYATVPTGLPVSVTASAPVATVA